MQLMRRTPRAPSNEPSVEVPACVPWCWGDQGIEGSDLGPSIQVPWTQWTQKSWIQAIPCFGRRTGDQEVAWPWEDNVQQSLTWAADLHQNQPQLLKGWWGLNSILCHTLNLCVGLRLDPSTHQTPKEMFAAPWIQDQTVAWEEEYGLCFESSFCWQAREAALKAWQHELPALLCSHPSHFHQEWVLTCQGLFTQQEYHREEELLCNTWILAVQDLFFPFEQEAKVQINFLNNTLFNS